MNTISTFPKMNWTLGVRGRFPRPVDFARRAILRETSALVCKRLSRWKIRIKIREAPETVCRIPELQILVWTSRNPVLQRSHVVRRSQQRREIATHTKLKISFTHVQYKDTDNLGGKQCSEVSSISVYWEIGAFIVEI